MKQETINEIRRALNNSNLWFYDPETNALFVQPEKLMYKAVDCPPELQSSIHAACLLLQHAPALLDEIERLTARVAELEDAYKHQKNKNALLEMKRDEQNAVLREATQKLVELNVENAEALALLWQARRDILQTARVNKMRLTGRDIVTGDMIVARPEVNQRGIDESLALAKSIEELTRKLQPDVKDCLTSEGENL